MLAAEEVKEGPPCTPHTRLFTAGLPWVCPYDDLMRASAQPKRGPFKTTDNVHACVCVHCAIHCERSSGDLLHVQGLLYGSLHTRGVYHPCSTHVLPGLMGRLPMACEHACMRGGRGGGGTWGHANCRALLSALGSLHIHGHVWESTCAAPRRGAYHECRATAAPLIQVQVQACQQGKDMTLYRQQELDGWAVTITPCSYRCSSKAAALHMHHARSRMYRTVPLPSLPCMPAHMHSPLVVRAWRCLANFNQIH